LFNVTPVASTGGGSLLSLLQAANNIAAVRAIEKGLRNLFILIKIFLFGCQPQATFNNRHKKKRGTQSLFASEVFDYLCYKQVSPRRLTDVSIGTYLVAF